MSERLHSKFESVGMPAHVNVQDELELECLASRCVNMFGKPCDEVQCVLEGRTHFVTFCKCDVHYDAVCSGRGHRLLSDQGGEL